MSLVDEKTMKNAEKCKEFMEATMNLVNKIDRHSVMAEEMEATVKQLARVAPHKADFEKIFGLSPYDYYMKKEKEK
ncbi:MAG: hypothetical protein MUD12_14615 [Spirochaetes bacterium]|jgi:ABC-type ATPase with predicted acetyltransferase domain|nr:hypothetical protein [Spirochaetota bacterium]